MHADFPGRRRMGRALAFIALALSLAGRSVAAGDEPVLQSGFIQVPGGPVWYEVAGEGGGTPLLTLHGGPGSTSCGLQLLYPLADERPVVRYDQLGTGRSGRPTDTSLWQRDRFVDRRRSRPPFCGRGRW